jgi:integrase
MTDLWGIPLDRLSVADLRAAHAGLARKAPRQAQIALAALKEALREAEEDGQRFDPALLKIKPNRYKSREPRFLTWEQVQELQSWMPEYICRIVPIAALTGLREGELFDLRESDLHLGVLSERDGPSRRDGDCSPTGSRISLSESYLIVRSGKTEASRRRVDLPATAVQLLREQLLARTHTESYVFPAPQGGRWNATNFLNRVFNPAKRRAGLDDITVHSLRHTFASLMGAAGVDVATIAAQMGHKDGGALLLRRYRHIFPAESRGAASKLDALVQSSETAEEEQAK